MSETMQNPAATGPDPETQGTAGVPTKETKGLSQGQIVRKKFFEHKAAVISMVVLILILLLAITSIGIGPIPGWWKYNFRDFYTQSGNAGAPTWDHPFGQDTIGRDYFAMTMRGIQLSLMVTVVIGAVAGTIGIVIGALAGYYRGWVEAILMRITDVIIIIPLILIAAVIGRNSSNLVGPGLQPLLLAVFLGCLVWISMARLVRAEFLTLREREFVDAARIAGASDLRIIFKHILPNAVGVIIVNLTLLLAAAILLETALSYLGFGVRPPDTSLGLLIVENQNAFQVRPWLFWWPGLFIIAICLCINFIGDGLRDAFDPRQKNFNPKKTLKVKGKRAAS